MVFSQNTYIDQPKNNNSSLHQREINYNLLK